MGMRKTTWSMGQAKAATNAEVRTRRAICRSHSHPSRLFIQYHVTHAAPKRMGRNCSHVRSHPRNSLAMTPVLGARRWLRGCSAVKARY